MCRWLFSKARATAIIATGVDEDNVASRRVLEKLGFAQTDHSGRRASYRLERHRDGTR
jgi:RimJ/RimL family protein N-acetyltransferase